MEFGLTNEMLKGVHENVKIKKKNILSSNCESIYVYFFVQEVESEDE